MFEERSEFRDPNLLKRIISLRNSGLRWKEIVETIEKEFNVKMSMPTAQRLFEKQVAKATLISPKIRDQAVSDYQLIHDRYDKACVWIDNLGKIFDNLYEKSQRGEISEAILLRIAPIIQSNSKELLNQLRFIREEQERISIQQKNLIYSPVQIINVIHRQLRDLEKEGYIRILKKLPRETEEEEDEKGTEEIEDEKSFQNNKEQEQRIK